MCSFLFVLENSALHYSEEQYKLKSASEELEKKLRECNDALYAIEEKLHNVNVEKEDFRTKLNDCLSVNNELNLAIRGLENEKEILSDQLKNKLGLIDSLTSEISELRTEAENVRKLKIEMMLKSEDIIGRESSIKVCISTPNHFIFRLKKLVGQTNYLTYSDTMTG